MRLTHFWVLLLVVGVHVGVLVLLSRLDTGVRNRPIDAVFVAQIEGPAKQRVKLPPSVVRAQAVPLEVPVPEFVPASADVAVSTSVAATIAGVPVDTPPSAPVRTVNLRSDLAVLCPERVAPAYPREAKRAREQGLVILRVELDEAGGVGKVSIEQSSRSRALDEAGIAAVRRWRCQPASRDGQPVRAVALQPFEFLLERR